MAIASHVDWLREGVSKWNRRRKKVHFKPDLSGLNFFEMLPKDFRDTPKTSRYFERIDLSDADLRSASLSNLNFERARFDGALLDGSNLSKTNFRKASFRNCSLNDIQAIRSDFTEATFEETDFKVTNIQGAIFADADLIGVLGVEKILIEAHAQTPNVYQNRKDYVEYRSSARLENQSYGRLAGAPENVDNRTRKNRYDVFFGTNRAPIIEREAVVGFSGDRGDRMQYGVCEVVVPDGHQMGSLGSPLYKRLWNRKDDRLRVDSLINLDENLFSENIIQSIKKMRDQARPTIFVHGYNNSFEAAVLRAAQLGFDLGIGMGIGLFSWPSKGHTKKYPADEAVIDPSKYSLAGFIELFVNCAGSDGVDIIAHSMGTRCLLGALEYLSHSRQHVLQNINQLILAAADVDTSHMDMLAQHPIGNCTRTTSYVCEKDKALKISSWLHDYSRVGLSPPTYVIDGMDTVLVNNKDLGDFNHGYFATSRTLLNDIFSLLRRNEEPSERFSIEQVSAGKQAFWRLKD